MFSVWLCSLTDMDVPLRVLLILTGLTGIHSITTVSKVSVKVEESISIPCLYDPQYIDYVKYLCKGYTWNNCIYAVNTNQQNSKKYSISDDKIKRIFTVTVRDLKVEDTDNYWCAVERNGLDVKKFFHLSVTTGASSLYTDQQKKTGFKGDELTINCNSSNPGEMRWCRLGGSCVTTGSSGSIDGTRVTINASVPNVFTVTMSGLKTESSGWYQCIKGDLQMPVHVTVTEPSTTTTSSTLSPTPEPLKITSVFAERTPTTVQGEQRRVSVDLKKILIPMSMLIFTFMVTLFIWFMLKRHEQNKSASSAMTEAEVIYNNVEHKRTTSNQRSNAEGDADMTYSCVVTTMQKSVQRVEANDENVIYSTVA